MLLGDLGADVIKIERPGNGDESRSWGPPFDAEGRSAYYLSINRNKLSVTCDFDSRADRDLIESLIGGADIVVDNFLPGVLGRRGLDPTNFCQRDRRLIWCTISGFGGASQRPGYDFVAQAECGWMAITGAVGGAPMKTGVALADVVTGKDAAIAILAALVARVRTQHGGRLHISLADSARAALLNVAQNTLVSGRESGRWGNAHPNLVPYQLFRVADGDLVIAVGSDVQWVACANALGLSDLAADPSLSTNPGRLTARERIVARFAERLVEKTAAEWSRVLDAARVPNGAVRSVLDVVRGVNASALNGMPSSVGGSVRLPPPRLNEHGALVRNRGWSAFEGLS